MKNPIEGSSERIPTKDEIIEVISHFAENAVLNRQLSDKLGVYLLEAQVKGKEEGDIVEYQYIRKGRHANHVQESKTSICIVYYKNGIPISGDTVSIYRPETNEWVKVFDPM